MSTITDALEKCANWNQPRSIEGSPFRHVCRVLPPATHAEIAAAWPGRSLPGELLELWENSMEAELFVDVDYGQWGLRLFSPAASAKRSARERENQPQDIAQGDVIIGEFLGDQDLLVLDENGSMLIALPYDSRADWFNPARNLADFLDQYVAASGDKYWEAAN